MQLTEDPEFEVLREQGFTSDYVYMSQGKIKPCTTLEDAINMGFFPKGTNVRWRPNAGFPYEANKAEREIGSERILTVKSCSIGSSSSTYEFEEIDGQWNTVMFKKVSD